MSDNTKSLTERRNTINDKGPNRWLTRNLEEVNRPIITRKITDPDQQLGVQEPQRTSTSSLADRAASVAGRQRSTPPSEGGGLSLPQSSGNMSTDGGSDNQEPRQAPNFGRLLSGVQERLGQGRQNAPHRRIAQRLEHPVAKERIENYFTKYGEEQGRINDSWDDLSTITDEDSAARFLSEGLGYSINPETGAITSGTPNRERRAMGGAGMPGEGRGESRAINFEELRALNNPEHQQRLAAAKEDGGRAIQALAIKNNIPWELAEKLYDRMERGMQGKLDGWGKPEGSQGTFTPLGPVEFLQDAEGNFTGETNIDALARTNPEEYARHFANNGGNRGRGIFLLQKLLANGARGQFTNLPSFFDLDTITPDHVMGRSSGEMPDGRFKDDPLNLILDRRGINQFKVSSQFDNEGGERERDTIDSLVNAAGRVRGALGGINGGEDFDGELFDNPAFQDWMAYRLDQGDFDPEKIAQRMGESGIDAYPETIEDLLELGPEVIKQLVSKGETKNPLGLNMRNMSMISPRANARPLVTNTWGGAPGGGLEFNPLEGYRRALLGGALFHPDMKRQMEEYTDEVNGHERWNEDRRTKEIDKKRRDLVDHNYFGPQKAIASLYGLGRLNNDEFIDRLNEFASSKTGFLEEGNPEAFGKLREGLGSTLEDYRGQLAERMPNGPHQFTDDELMENLNQPYMRSIMTSNYGRSKMPQALVEAFDKLSAPDFDNMYEDNFLTPDTNLL